jgi:hypothetical protein
MKEREYLHLKRQIEAEYREKMQALDLVWRMAGKPEQRAGRFPRNAIQQLVRTFVSEWRDGDFSVDEVFKYLRQQAPSAVLNRSSVSKALRRLVLNRELEITAQGKGSKPSQYRRVEGGSKAA